MTKRLEAMGQEKYAGLVNAGKGHFNGVARLVPEDLALPLRWRKPARVFVNSMSDLFHEALTNEQIAAVFGVMAACPQHKFQVLTKRPERAVEWFEWASAYPVGTPDCLCQREAYKIVRDKLPLHTVKGTLKHYPWPLPNVWLGVSAEHQDTADARIPHLLQTPAAVRFVSYEPALGLVNFRGGSYGPDWLEGWDVEPVCCGRPGSECCGEPEAQQIQTERLDWIIVGGESGPGARPFDVEWARSTIRQCREAGVACFVKQLGGNRMEDGYTDPGHTPSLDRVRARKGDDPSEWPGDLRVREYPETRV